MKTKIDIQGLFEHWVTETKHPEGSYDLTKLKDSTTYVEPETRCAFRGFCAVFELFGSSVGWLVSTSGDYNFFTYYEEAFYVRKSYEDYHLSHPDGPDPDMQRELPEPVWVLGQNYLRFVSK